MSFGLSMIFRNQPIFSMNCVQSLSKNRHRWCSLLSFGRGAALTVLNTSLNVFDLVLIIGKLTMSMEKLIG